MPWVCPQCRNTIKNNDRFCRVCGTPLSVAPGAESAPSSGGGSRTAGWILVAVLLGGVVLGGGWMFTRAFKNAQNQIAFSAGSDAFNQAATLYNNKDYKNAAEAFKRIRLGGTATGVTLEKATDGEVYSYRELGHAAQNAQNWNGALYWYQQALSVKPDDPQTKTELDAIRKVADAALPNPPSDASPSPDHTTEFPKRAAPGTPNTSASDFTNRNAAAAQEALSLYQQGELANNNHNQAEALKLWADAVAKAPGSPGAMQAQQRLTEYAQNNNPFDKLN